MMRKVPETVQGVGNHNSPMPESQTYQCGCREHQGNTALCRERLTPPILNSEAYVDASYECKDDGCKLMRYVVWQNEMRWKANGSKECTDTSGTFAHQVLKVRNRQFLSSRR